MSQQALVKTTERAMEFVPFGETDKIKLTVQIVMNICATPTRSGKLPTEKDAIQFMMLCMAMKLNPFVRDAYLVGYDTKDGAKFNLITAHQSLLKRAEASLDFEGMESGIILQDGDGKITEREGDFCTVAEIEQVVGGWARVYRKGRKDTIRKLALHQRRPAYETPFWQGGKAAEQIVKCAEADALRSTFPTLLGGMYHGAEIIEIDAAKVPADTKLIDLAPVVSETRQTAASAEPANGGEPAQPGNALPASSKDRLADAVVNGGFTFDHFAAWARGSGQIPEPQALDGFDDVTEATAKRLLRVLPMVLKGCGEAKGAA